MSNVLSTITATVSTALSAVTVNFYFYCISALSTVTAHCVNCYCTLYCTLSYSYVPDVFCSSASEWLKVTPWGLRQTLQWIKGMYNNPLVYITENGISDSTGVLQDVDRVSYYKLHINEMLKGVLDFVSIVFNATVSPK